MGFKRCAAALLAVLSVLCAASHAWAAAEPLGTVPWLLTATSEEDARYRQCSLGDAVSDAVRAYLGADIAIVNGGDLIGNLQPGEATSADVRGCLRADKTLATARVSGAELLEILEAALSHVTLTARREYDGEASAHDAFPQISGFRLSYDPGAAPGERISRLTYQDRPVQPEDSFLLAATEEMLAGGYGLPAVADYTQSQETLGSVLEQYIRDGMEDYAIPRTRVYAMEVRTRRAFDRSTILMVVALAAVLALLFLPLGKKFVNLNKKK